MSFLVNIDTAAPTPKMVKSAANAFRKLREIVRAGSGVDFLAKCGDVFRSAHFVSKKSGVADRSWHKTGRAFDYDQTSPAIVVVSEPIGGKQYFRTWIRATGGNCIKRTVQDFRGFNVSAPLFDFTATAEAQGFKRIPAWSNWRRVYTQMEFWHYQYDEGLSWDAAMRMLKANGGGEITDARSTPHAVIGLNDRDQNTKGLVTKIQTALAFAGLLPTKEIDGVYGPKTRNAVAAFQRLKRLAADGLAGPQTQAAMELQK